MQRELRLLNNKHCIEYLQFLSKNHLSFNLEVRHLLEEFERLLACKEN